MNLIPVNARFFLESLFGKTSPITEKDFSTEELNVLREVGNKTYIEKPQRERTNYQHQIRSSGYLPQTLLRQIDETHSIPFTPTSKQAGYEDYYPSPDTLSWNRALQETLTNPNYRIATSLGNFGVEDKGDHYSIYDSYQWNGDFARPIQSLSDVFKEGRLDRPTLVLNALAELFAPKVQRPVNIKVMK